MTIKFEKIIPNDFQINELYNLLTIKKYPISHKTLPSESEHCNFVFHHPYVVWYLLYKNMSLIGSVYVQFDNSIGMNLIEYDQEDLLKVINHIKNNYSPLPSIKSFRRGSFFLNVSSKDTPLIKILKKLEKVEIQRSFIL